MTQMSATQELLGGGMEHLCPLNFVFCMKSQQVIYVVHNEPISNDFISYIIGGLYCPPVISAKLCQAWVVFRGRCWQVGLS